MKRFVTILCLSLTLLVGTLFVSIPAWAAPEQSPSPDGAYAYIIEPGDRATVSSPFSVKFGLSGMGIAPAGVDVDNTGHHHLLIDLDELPDVTQPLAATDQIKHFGAGQTETEVSLSSGEHTLQLVLGNYVHVPHNKPVVSDPVHITVE